MIEYHYQGRWMQAKELLPFAGVGYTSVHYWAARNKLPRRRVLAKPYRMQQVSSEQRGSQRCL